MKKNLKLVDIVLEIIDARIPESSRNPMLDDILADKPRMIIMNKSDLADPLENQKWINKFKNEGIVALPMNSKERINVGKIYDIAREILSDKFKKHEEKDINNPLIRMMIVGEDDLMWDSLAMENKIKEQNPKAKIYSYKGAGHIFAGNGILDLGKIRVATGWTAESNEKAKSESRKTIDAFLKENHK